MEVEDDVFLADLNKQISLLIMDDDEDQVTHCPSVSLQSRFKNEVQQLNGQLALLQRMYKDARAEISVLKAENKELKRKATVMFRFGGPPYTVVEEQSGVIVPSGAGNTEAAPSRTAQDGGKRKRPAAE